MKITNITLLMFAALLTTGAFADGGDQGNGADECITSIAYEYSCTVTKNVSPVWKQTYTFTNKNDPNGGMQGPGFRLHLCYMKEGSADFNAPKKIKLAAFMTIFSPIGSENSADTETSVPIDQKEFNFSGTLSEVPVKTEPAINMTIWVYCKKIK